MLEFGQDSGCFSGSFMRRSGRGDVLILHLFTPLGYQQHVWIPREYASPIPRNLKTGQRMRFQADLKDKRIRKRVNLVHIRHLEVQA